MKERMKETERKHPNKNINPKFNPNFNPEQGYLSNREDKGDLIIEEIRTTTIIE
jgi:hypothetical protein